MKFWNYRFNSYFEVKIAVVGIDNKSKKINYGK